MTTSNSINFTVDTEACLRLALIEIGVIGAGDYIDNFDSYTSKMMLNMMLKSWQSQDNHLWVKQTITLFLQQAQTAYDISNTTIDHLTADNVVRTQLLADAALSATTLIVSSTTGMIANDKIGLVMDNNYLFWTTISSIPVPGTINLTLPTTYAAGTGATVFTYRNALALPFQVYSAVRRDYVNNIDVPLSNLSYREYSDQPNKSSLGIVTMWAQDRQVDDYRINVWLAPNDVSYYLRLVTARKIQDVDVNADTFDLPQEWQLAVVKNLAVLLAPSYGKAQGDNFMELKLQAKELLQEAKNFDNEMGSIYIKPNADGFRRP